jgi:hypothetical protein
VIVPEELKEAFSRKEDWPRERYHGSIGILLGIEELALQPRRLELVGNLGLFMSPLSSTTILGGRHENISPAKTEFSQACMMMRRTAAPLVQKTFRIKQEDKAFQMGDAMGDYVPKTCNKELSEERKRVGEALAEQEAARVEPMELRKQLGEHIEECSEMSSVVQEERCSMESLRKEVEDLRIIFEERNISQLAEITKLGESFEVTENEKDAIAFETAQSEAALLKGEEMYTKEVHKFEEVSQQLVIQQEACQDLEKSKLELEQKNVALVRDVESAVERLEALEKEKFEFREKIDEFETEKKTLASDKGLLDAKVSGYEDHIKGLGAMIKEKEATIENLTDHMETQRNHHLKMDAELTSANDKIANLEKKLVSKTQEAAPAASGQDNKSKEAAVLQATIEEKSQQLMEVQTAYDLKCLEMQEKELEVEKTNEHLGAVGEQMGILNAELAEVKDNLEIKDKETEINEVVSKTTELAVTIENFPDKIHTLEEELTESAKTSDVKKQELVVKISELESKLAESEVNANDLNEQISTKKAEAEEHALEQEKEREDLSENLTAYAEQLRVAREQESKLQKEKVSAYKKKGPFKSKLMAIQNLLLFYGIEEQKHDKMKWLMEEEQGAVRVDKMADRNQINGPTCNDEESNDDALQRIGGQDSVSVDSPVVAHRALRVKHGVMWMKSHGRISGMLKDAEGAVGHCEGATHQSWSVDLPVGHEPLKANSDSMNNSEVIGMEGAVVLRLVDTTGKVNMNLEHNYDTANDLLRSDTVEHAPWDRLLLLGSARNYPTKVIVISNKIQDTALPCHSCEWRDTVHGDLHDREHGQQQVDGVDAGGRMLKFNTMWRNCSTSKQVIVTGSEPIDTAQSCHSSVRRDVVLGADVGGLSREAVWSIPVMKGQPDVEESLEEVFEDICGAGGTVVSESWPDVIDWYNEGAATHLLVSLVSHLMEKSVDVVIIPAGKGLKVNKINID